MLNIDRESMEKARNTKGNLNRMFTPNKHVRENKTESLHSERNINAHPLPYT